MSVAALFSSDAPARFGETILGEMPNYAAKLDEPIIESTPAHRGAPWARKSRRKKAREAIELRRLEGVLAVGIWLYEKVRLVERNWRREVIEGKAIYDPLEEASIVDFFRQWSIPCDRCIKEIDHFAARDERVEGGDQFNSYCAEARRMLAGQSPFFEDPQNVVRWAGVTEFVHPKPRPVQVDEQGRIFEMNGEQFVFPGLEPERVLAAQEQVRSGRFKSFEEIVASRTQNGI